jgi:hypothetical protein
MIFELNLNAHLNGHLSRVLLHLGAFMAITAASVAIASGQENDDRIRPCDSNRLYWQYRGSPVLLIGASDEDNLFNHPDLPPVGLERHLDRLAEAGGNYVRNTMSSRDEGNVWPFLLRSDGLYDLREPSSEYWQRFEEFLEMTLARDIIVQIEIWDRFDYAREPWLVNPFNPKNNVNYTAQESGLPERIDSHPGKLENPFFRSTDGPDRRPELLSFQQSHVKRMLEISLRYPHVLYCISNETNDSEAWSRYWAKFLRNHAAQADKAIEVTEMWDAWDLSSPMHGRTFDHPELFSFVDVSQNSHQIGQKQWDNLQLARKLVSDPPRPVNSVKTYGGNHGGGPVEGQHKLWRNILGGTASSRYHRPGGGVGLNDVTEAHLRSLRMVLERVDIFTAEPNHQLLTERQDDEVYMAAVPGKQYALYFPDDGDVKLDVGPTSGTVKVRWLDVLQHRWLDDWEKKGGSERLPLKTPGKGPWAAVVLVD